MLGLLNNNNTSYELILCYFVGFKLPYSIHFCTLFSKIKLIAILKKYIYEKRAEQQDYSRFQLFKILYVLFIQNQVF